MEKINIAVERRFNSKKLVLSNVPKELTQRKIVCEWWASRYGTSTIINGPNPDYPAKTWCAEVGIQ